VGVWILGGDRRSSSRRAVAAIAIVAIVVAIDC
jgi:hypothetical protein